MKWIVITLPDFIENESTYINQLFKAGIDLLHLRKPESNIEECKQLIPTSFISKATASISAGVA